MEKIKLSELSKGASFGCCGSHHLCEMGRKKCVHVDVDPDYSMLCTVYLRQQGLIYPPIEGVEVSIRTTPILKEGPFLMEANEPVEPLFAETPSLQENKEEEEVESADANGQLLLF
ncbi:hypothetical protein [Aneurinibacillus tyrosinisolvens]|uniref:hypothetical protein n=1 Tax=Aneurinibacillus tyrosinisolvens TaxID=1443435 RepID=UPI00063EEB64|nr:hypothetical protein [Aneurinibacillus tyrosinisolvens]